MDGYALIYRAFFALLSRPLTTVHGENTSAAWGVVNFLIRLSANHSPAHVVWVHDSGLSFRHEVLPEYKATREKLTHELQADFDQGLKRIEDLLTAYRVPIISVAGYEADDVIGSLARQAVDSGLNVVIVSGDKDFQQCVQPGVWLLNPGRGGPAGVDEQFIATENARERLGVSPEHTTDYLALVGDTSDNVPGVPGIGEKTARELIETYGDLESILRHAAEIPKKRPREALLEFADRARLSKQLVTLRYDVPIVMDLEAYRVKPPDSARLRQLFIELEFTSLLKLVESEPAGPPITETSIRYTLIDGIPALTALVEQLRSLETFSIATEIVCDPDSPNESDPLRSRLVGLAIGVSTGEAFYLPFGHRTSRSSQGDLLLNADGVAPKSGLSNKGNASKKRSIAGQLLDTDQSEPRNLPELMSEPMHDLVDLLRDPLIVKVAHNGKREFEILQRAGIRLGGLRFDTMLASYVLDPGRRSHDLDLLALEFLDLGMTSLEALSGKGKDKVPFDIVPTTAACRFSCEKADYILRLRGTLQPQLDAHGLLELLQTIELPLVDVLSEMEWTGIAIDIKWFRSLKERFQRERERVESEIYEVAGERFNINSNQQLRVVLFEKLQLPVKKKTVTGASTDASVLQELAEEGHRLPVLLMEYRELAKLESTYLDALPKLVHPDDGRLHTSFNQTVAATGRLSSSDPNLQNIPIRRELGRDIRRGFVARAGWQLLAADYSQIELRLLAHLSRDAAFVDAFTRGGDIHRETAAIIFGLPAVDVNSEMRSRAKTINFATIYGQGPVALARQLKISIAEAKTFIATYFERFRGVREYLDSQVGFAREHGYVETVFHRRRYIPELKDRNFNIRSFGERVATNAPIQGSAADLIKIAMIRIHRRLHEEELQSRMLLQVHDELVFELAPGEIEQVCELVRNEMEHAAELSVPLVVDLGVGPNWLETKPR
ncbi:MAG: DNA polymerase I [Gemmatimonadaceae bacterium]